MFSPQAKEALERYLGYSSARADVPLETLRERGAGLRKFLDTNPDMFASASGDDRAVGWIETQMDAMDKPRLTRALLLTATAHGECHLEDPATQVALIDDLLQVL